MDEAFTEYRKQGYIPGRIGMECRGMYKVYTESGMVMGQLSGKMHYTAEDEGLHPAAGDWAAVEEMLQLWKGEDTLANVFNDIEELAKSCRFKDCSHKKNLGVLF